MIFRRSKPSQAPAPDVRERLLAAVATELPEEDEPTRRIVAAVAGLLACVAYADREYSEPEQARVHEELGRVHGLSGSGAAAIGRVLARDIVRLATAGDQGWARDLKELAERELRIEVLQVLVDLAAADEELTLAETNHLRRLTTGLGLEQRDYDAAQAHHRDKLTILRQRDPR